MARSIWRSENGCLDLKAGMVIKYADAKDNVSGYYLITYEKSVVLALKSRLSDCGQGHLGPVNKNSVLEVWESLSDFLWDMGINVLTDPINF
jgi:hypothetical protein